MTACLTAPYALVGEQKLSQEAYQKPRYFAPVVVEAPVAKPPAIPAARVVAAPAKSPLVETGAIPAVVAPLKAQ